MHAIREEDEQEFGAPLAATDAQAALVDDAIAQYSEMESEAMAAEGRGEGEAEESEVPTEFLQEDANALLELPPTTRRPSPIAQLVAYRPLSVVLAAVLIAVVSAMWLAVGGSLHLSLDEELLEANSDPLVRHHDSVLHLQDFDSNVQLAENEVLGELMEADNQRRLLHVASDISSRSGVAGGGNLTINDKNEPAASASRRRLSPAVATHVCSPSDARTRLTLLYEARSGDSLLIPEALEAVHSIEADLKRTLHAEGICWADEACECLPFDSIASYLYPRIVNPASAQPALVADGGAPTRPVCAPSYSVGDLGSALGWLADHGKSAFARRKDTTALLSQRQLQHDAHQGNASGLHADTVHSNLENDMSNAAAAEDIAAAAGVAPSRYLRTYVFLSRSKWHAAKQADPAVTARLRAALDKAASSLRVRCVPFGSQDPLYAPLLPAPRRPHTALPSELNLTFFLRRPTRCHSARMYYELEEPGKVVINAEQMEWLKSDIWLLVSALCLIGIYMRLAFRSTALALLAPLQIVLSFPLMFWAVGTLFGQAQLSVLVLATLFVVAGVSSDNLFVVHETWRQSALLTFRGRPAELPDRVWWTLRSAGHPLLIADVTTAFALFINCLSSIEAIYQFGLCGGVLILLNFVLALTYMPALLVLEETGRLPRTQPPSPEHTAARMHSLDAIHRTLSRRKYAILLAFVVGVAALVPSALDVTATKSPSPTLFDQTESERAFAHIRSVPALAHILAPPPAAADAAPFIGDKAHPSTGYDFAVSRKMLTHAELEAAAAAGSWPDRYLHTLDGTARPPPPLGTLSYAVSLGSLLFLDAAFLGALGVACLFASPVGVFCPPSDSHGTPLSGRFACVSSGPIGLLSIAASALALICSIGLLTLSGFPEAFYHQLTCRGSVHTIGPLLGALVLLHSPPLIFLGLALRWEQPVFIFAPPISCEGHGSQAASRRALGSLAAFCLSLTSFMWGLSLLSRTAAPAGDVAAAPTSSQADNGGGDDIFGADGGHGWHIAGAASLGVWLALVLLWDSLVVMLAALASATGTQIANLAPPRPGSDSGLAEAAGLRGSAALLHIAGWSVLLLSGMPTAFTSTFGHGAGAVGNALGLLLLLNAAAHGLTLACQVTGDRVWVLAPTADWADRPPWPLAVHFVAGLLFALFGVWSLLVANDDTVDWIGCPSDAAALATHLAPGAEPPLMSRLSLVDLHQCAKQQERLADSAAATLSLQHEAFASQRQYALSLSLLLCLDGGLCLLAAYVVYGGRQVGAIRPPDPADNSRTTAQMSDDAGDAEDDIIDHEDEGDEGSGGYGGMAAVGEDGSWEERSDPGAFFDAPALLARINTLSGFSRAHLGAFSVAGLLLEGWAITLLGLALTPAAFHAAFGTGAAAGTALGLMLVFVHSPGFGMLSLVFRANRPMWVFAPTRASQRSLLPCGLSAMASVLSLVFGVAIWHRSDALTAQLPPMPPPMPPPPPPSHAAEMATPLGGWTMGSSGSTDTPGEGVLLSLLLLVVAANLAAAGMVQLRNRPRAYLRPHPGCRTAAERATLGVQLLVTALAMGWAAVAVFFVAANPLLAESVLGHHRVLPITTEIALVLFSCFLAWASYCMGARLCFGILQPPPSAYASDSPKRLCAWIAAALILLAVLLPLLSCNGDSLCAFEAYSNGLVALLVHAIFVTHGQYTGQVKANMYFIRDPKHVRTCSYLVTTALMAAAGIGYLRALFPPGSIRLHSYGLAPVPLVLCCAGASVCLVSWPALAIAADVRYTGRAICGFEPLDGPPGRRADKVKGFFMLLLSMIVATGGAIMLTAATTLISIDTDAPPGRGGAQDLSGGWTAAQVPIAEAELCHVVWGLDELIFPHTAAGDAAAVLADPSPVGIEFLDGFRPEVPAAQLELLRVCSFLTPERLEASRDYSPLHSQQPAVTCVMAELNAWLRANGEAKGFGTRALPVAEALFAPAMVSLLRDRPELRSHVGFTNATLARVGWLRIDLYAQFARAGARAVEYALDPQFLAAARERWDAWFDGLGGADTAAVAAGGASKSVSVLRFGWHDCPKWGMLATERAFLEGVGRACITTPLFTMAMILPFLRSVSMAYLVMVTLLLMVVTTLGSLRLLGIPLGAVEALALSLVMGVSVDYIVHLAYAYVHTMTEDRFHKSRAALAARTQSISAAAATTLLTILPMLLAHMRPLRQVGAIVGLVTIISLVFAMLFFAALVMVIGPRRTRKWPKGMPTPARTRRTDGHGGGGDDDESEDPLTGANGEVINGVRPGQGWGLHVDVSDIMDIHGSHGGSGMEVSDLADSRRGDRRSEQYQSRLNRARSSNRAAKARSATRVGGGRGSSGDASVGTAGGAHHGGSIPSGGGSGGGRQADEQDDDDDEML